MGADFSTCCGASADRDSTLDVTAATNPREPGNVLNRGGRKDSTSGNNDGRQQGGSGSGAFNGAPTDGSTSRPTFSVKEREQFREKLHSGISVNLILQDKTKLLCQVKLGPDDEFLMLSCDKKVRAISMRDIRAVLHTKDQLKRVESAANITDIEICAAVHLSGSGNCIPLFFHTNMEKELFVSLVEEARSAVTAKESTGASA